MESKDIKVAAVVVTYNRLQLLKECVEALRNQTYKNVDFIIVNNGSTDGTGEWLASQKDLIVITQANLGGAGGFYTGMKYMFDNGYDALLMMDDDGLADSHQLEYLVKYSQKYNLDLANALVLNKNNPSETLWSSGTSKSLYDGEEVILGKSFLFNGTFVQRHVIEKIGFVKREMFIWGDDMDYKARVRCAGFRIGTIPKAIHYHPPFKGIKKRIIPFISKGTITYKPEPINKIYYRNLGYLDANYFGHKNFIKYFTYYLLRLRFKEFSYFYKYYKMGSNNDFSINLINRK